MAIITTITDRNTKISTGLNSSEILSSLIYSYNKSTAFREETFRKLSNALSGKIPSFKSKGNTGVAAKAAGMNP